MVTGRIHFAERTALLGFGAGLAIAALNAVHVNEYLLTMGPVLAVACLAYLVGSRPTWLEAEALHSSGQPRFILLAGTTLAVLDAVLVLLVASAASRGTAFFVTYAVAAGTTVLASAQSIPSRGWLAGLLCAQVVFLGIAIRVSAFYALEGIPGIDSIAHASAIETYSLSGHIPDTIVPYNGFNHYSSMPLAHILGHVTCTLTGVDAKTGMFLAWSVPGVLASLAVFLLGRSVFDASVGLIAMLLATTADYQILWGAQNPIVMQVGIIYFATLAILLWGIPSSASTKRLVLGILFIAATVFTHPVAYVICALMAALLGVTLVVSRRFLRDPASVALPGFGVLAIIVALFYVHTNFLNPTPSGASFLESMTLWYHRSLSTEAAFLARGLEGTDLVGVLPAMLDVAGHASLLGLSAHGCLLVLNKPALNARRLAFVVVLPLVVGLPFAFPLFGISNIEPTRWPAFYYMIASVPAAVALMTWFRSWPSRLARHVSLLSALAVLTFLMTTNSVSNADSPLYATELNEPTVYSSSDLAVAGFLKNALASAVADSRYAQYLERGYGIDVRALTDEPSESHAVSLFVWRQALYGRPAIIRTDQGGFELTVIPQDYLTRVQMDSHRVYSNATVAVTLPRQ